MIYQKFKTPIGMLTLVASDKALLSLTFGDEVPSQFNKASNQENRISEQAKLQIEEYFSGTRTEFSVPVDPVGTEFQKQVWRELQNIPYGLTVTYGTQAAKIGKPSASRAVGAANGKNPIAIIIPCHRVVGANGSLTGFSGGLHIKSELLKLEGSLRNDANTRLIAFSGL